MVTLVPTNAEPHDYEPTPQDIQRLQNAKAYVALGVEFAEFEDQVTSTAKAPVIAAGQGITLLNAEGEETLPGGKDPHIWLSPINAITQVENEDHDGRLWRFQEGHLVQLYDVQATTALPDLTYDLKDGRYFANRLFSEDALFRYDEKMKSSEFLPPSKAARTIVFEICQVNNSAHFANGSKHQSHQGFPWLPQGRRSDVRRVLSDRRGVLRCRPRAFAELPQ